MENLEQIRSAEARSHAEAYTNHILFEPGSWMAKPVKTVLDLIDTMQGSEGLRVLDLGCGVGRNCIPVAQMLNAQVLCVDILPMAIDLLCKNAEKYGVSDKIQGVVSGIDAFSITENSFDLILAVSALEHMDSPKNFTSKLEEIASGLRPGGISCLIINSGIKEQDSETREPLPAQFEINLPTQELQSKLHHIFGGMQIMKEKVVHQEYDIPRENGISHLSTDVVTYVIRK